MPPLSPQTRATLKPLVRLTAAALVAVTLLWLLALLTGAARLVFVVHGLSGLVLTALVLWRWLGLLGGRPGLALLVVAVSVTVGSLVHAILTLRAVTMAESVGLELANPDSPAGSIAAMLMRV